jgi:predicted deacylase
MLNRLLFLFLVVFYSSYGFSQGGFEGAILKKQGSSREDFLVKFSDSLGNETTLPAVVFHGNEEGPVFTIVAGVHGFEYPPIVAAQELLREIDPMQLRGTLIFIPIANKGSFYSRPPFLNALDKKNLNGVFPGNKKGTVTEKIAHFISTKIIPLSDIFMDMHGEKLQKTYSLLCAITTIRNTLNRPKKQGPYLKGPDFNILFRMIIT